MSNYDKSQFVGWKRPYRLQRDTTTYCNAKCPQCSRTNPSQGAGLSFRGKTLNNKGDTRYTGDLPLINVKMEDFQRGFNKETLRDIGYIQFCPTWGDHMMHPMAHEMIEHVLSHSTNTQIEVVTNGSMRDEEWWWRFASLSYKYQNQSFKRLGVVFDVDGINQEMHARYRRNTDLEKVLSHMKICSEFNKHMITRSQTILFKHNENYLKDIEALCKKNGSVRHSAIVSDRFYGSWTNNKDEFYFYDEDDEKQVLKRVSESFRNKFREEGARVHGGEYELQEKIVCSWSITNKLNIDFHGNVWPCCFFGNSYSNNKNYFLRGPYIQEYFKYNNNIYEKSINEILKTDWWKKLPETFNSDNPIHNCVMNCSNKVKLGQLRKRKDF